MTKEYEQFTKDCVDFAIWCFQDMKDDIVFNIKYIAVLALWFILIKGVIS